ncbi:hypothetical protein [Paenibacillus sp. FSL R5-0519]
MSFEWTIEVSGQADGVHNRRKTNEYLAYEYLIHTGPVGVQN